jgi:hypothetical protein
MDTTAVESWPCRWRISKLEEFLVLLRGCRLKPSMMEQRDAQADGQQK